MIPLRDDIDSETYPFVNWALIAINAYIFYLELKAGKSTGLQHFINKWGVIPVHLFHDPKIYWYSLVTAAFVHGGWMHIIGNMLFLYIFGRNVEDRMGHLKYLIFYLLVGMIANGTQAYLSATSKLPLVGASGAIAGVLGCYFFYYPYARIMTLITFGFFTRIIEVPAFIFLGIWFLLQTLNSTAFLAAQSSIHQATGGVAWIAHASGFVAGLIMAPFFGEQRDRFK